MHYLLVDQLYAKKVYFCSFVTKSNQTSTKYSPDAFSSFYRTMGFSQPPSLLIQGFPTFHYKIFSFCRLSIFFIKKLQAPSKRYTYLQKVFTSLFTCQFSASKKKCLFGASSPHFSYYILMTFLMKLSVILLSMLMMLLLILSVIRHWICGKNYSWLLKLNLIYKTLWTGSESGLLISRLEKISWFCLIGLTTLMLLMWK